MTAISLLERNEVSKRALAVTGRVRVRHATDHGPEIKREPRPLNEREKRRLERLLVACPVVKCEGHGHVSI